MLNSSPAEERDSKGTNGELKEEVKHADNGALGEKESGFPGGVCMGNALDHMDLMTGDFAAWCILIIFLLTSRPC